MECYAHERGKTWSGKLSLKKKKLNSNRLTWSRSFAYGDQVTTHLHFTWRELFSLLDKAAHI